MPAAASLKLPARVMFADAPAVLDELSAQAGEGAFEADLSACTEFDSSLIGVLLELLRRAGATAGECRLRDADENLRKLASLYGVDELLFARGEPAR